MLDCLDPKQFLLYYNNAMKVFQIQDDWGLTHLKLATRPDPRPGPGQVLLRMRAASLNYRDLLVPSRGYGVHTGTPRVAAGAGVAPCSPQGWIDGPPDAAHLKLGGPLDGTMAELMCLPAEGV